jgi:hypothetical protein
MRTSRRGMLPIDLRRRLRAGALAAACLASSLGETGATCGSANCFLVTGTQDGVGSKGSLVFDLSYRYVDQSRKLSGSREVSQALTPKVDFENGMLEIDHHSEIRTQNTLVEVDLAYGLTDRVTIAAGLPILNDRFHEHYDDADTPSPTFTNQDGASGFGDVRLGARYAFIVKTKDLLVGGLAVKLPTGSYRLLDSEGAINEPTIQPGTGSTDLIASLYYAHQVVPMRVEYFLSGSHRRNQENSLDYIFGDESIVSAGVECAAGDRIAWSLQVNGRRTSRDTFLGGEVPSTGSTNVNVTPGLRVKGGNGASIYGFVQFPVFEKVNETNLAPRYSLLLGASKTF